MFTSFFRSVIALKALEHCEGKKKIWIQSRRRCTAWQLRLLMHRSDGKLTDMIMTMTTMTTMAMMAMTLKCSWQCSALTTE